LRKGDIQPQTGRIGLLSWWEVGCHWLTEVDWSEEGRSAQGDCLSKVKAMILSTKVFDPTRGSREAQAQEDHSLEKRYLPGPMMTALAPECSKARGQKRWAVPIQRVTVQALRKCPDWNLVVGKSVLAALPK
jgi:hypothetical protein